MGTDDNGCESCEHRGLEINSLSLCGYHRFDDGVTVIKADLCDTLKRLSL